MVAPKKVRLAEAEDELQKTMNNLNAKRAELAAVEKRLADLQTTFQEMTEKKEKLEFQVSRGFWLCSSWFDNSSSKDRGTLLTCLHVFLQLFFIEKKLYKH